MYATNKIETFRPACGCRHGPSRACFILCLLMTSLFYVTAATKTASAATYYCDPVSGNTTQGDGTAGNPWGTLESVFTAGKFGTTVLGGDTVKLLSGYHGQISRYGEHNTSDVIIEAETGQTPQLGRFNIYGGSYWVLRGLTVSPELVPGGSSYTGPLISVTNHNTWGDAHHITVEYSVAYSKEDISAWDANDWNTKANYTGIQVAGPKGVNANNIVRYNIIKNIDIGILAGGEGDLIERNTIINFSTRGIHSGYDNQTFQYNIIKNLYKTVPTAHNDGILLDSGDRPQLTNITIIGNIIIEWEDPEQPYRGGLQGILDSSGPGINKNWLVENNVIIVEGHGISVKDPNNSRFINNTLARPIGALNTSYYPQIRFYNAPAPDGSEYGSNTVVRNNIAGAFPKPNVTDNVVVEYNLDLDDYDPNVLFRNYPLLDFHLVSTSPAVDAGSSNLAPNVDADKNTRPQGAGFDIGAYEYADSNNRAPVLQAIGNKSVNENSTLSFSVSATDADSDTITYSATGLPGGATFSSQSFSWTPGYTQAGTYQVTFTASDGTASDSETITITVTDASTLLYGDVNTDGSIDILDVQACVNHILGVQDWGTKADVNEDGSIDVLDVQGIVNIILEG